MSPDYCRSTLPVPIPTKVSFRIKQQNNQSFSTILITWEVVADELDTDKFANIQSFKIQLSLTAQPFIPLTEDGYTTASAASRSIEIKAFEPLWETKLFARVLVNTDYDSEGVWSDKSETWLTSIDCPRRWLDNRSLMPKNWTCQTCPEGADCTGKPYASVKSKFGYSRIPSSSIPDTFQLCLYPAACLGAPNDAFVGRFFTNDNETSKEDYCLVDSPESCNEAYGFEIGSRKCHACRLGYRRQGRVRCAKCPPPSQNYFLIVLGIIFVVFAVVFFVKVTVKDAGRTKISENIQKVIINFLQIITVFSGFSLRWPPAMQALFDFQGSISTVGDHLLNPDCVSTYATAADLYYTKQVGYTVLPFVVVIVLWIVWTAIAKFKKIDFYLRKDYVTSTPKDKFVVSVSVLLYLIFPTLVNQAFSIFNCIEVEDGHYYLLADRKF